MGPSSETSIQVFLQHKSLHHVKVMKNELQAAGQTEKRLSTFIRSAS